MDKQLKLGFFGFGCVGQGLYDIFQKTDFPAEVVKICVKDKNKTRSLPQDYFTFEAKDILDDPSINVIVEMINHADEAYQIVKYALSHGKHVVTANKKMLAEHLSELISLQQKYGTSLLYEASACGSIPIIRNLAEYYDNEWLFSVSGIFNGSSNYILSKIFQENADYHTALKQAQELGFAETDPTLDVGGFDAKYKLCIITAQAYGLVVHPDQVLNYGIQNLSTDDIQLAREKGYKIKMVASVEKNEQNEVFLSVVPQFVDKQHYLYTVENEYNAVILEAAFSQKQLLFGKGAGGHPTGSAVLSDISALRYDYRYEYRKMTEGKKLHYSQNQQIEIYLRYQHETDLALFDFDEIKVEHKSPTTNYVIGITNQAKIFENLENIRKAPLFWVKIANAPQKVTHNADKKAQYTDELTA
ncbi:MAG: homoserine dehydrogenase [Cytophagales bacterium]|nr:MAG: homoserine dehydrogenase [Cytophagales bacterium]